MTEEKLVKEGSVAVASTPSPDKALLVTVGANGEVGAPSEKATLMEKEGEIAEEIAPPDRFRAVYLILLLHGVGTLMPWNMFITANDYFEIYKLGGPPVNKCVEFENVTTNCSMIVSDGEEYRAYFLQYLGFVAQVPNVLLNCINVFCQVKGGNTSVRIVWSIVVIILMFIVTVILAMVDSSNWKAAFFFLTMITVVIINMANGIYQNSVYGLAAVLPMKYTNAVVLGSNTSGTLTAVIALIAKASAPDPRSSAIYYFLAAIIILIIAFDTFYALPFLPFYRYHKKKAELETEKSGSSGTRPPFWYIFKKCWVQLISVFLVFFVTLACFPAIQAGIVAVDPNFPINEKFFVTVTCFLFFNAFAVLGNLVTEFIKFPGPRWVWLPVAVRLLFIPFFMFCNFKPAERTIPVLISNDYVYIVGGILMAFTSGYFSSLAMMYTPRNVEVEHQGVAGMMAAFFLILGIFFGVLFSFPVAYMITNL